MDTFEHDHSLFASDKGDKSLFVQFYMHYLENQEKSKEAGRPIFDDTEFVKIFSPGDRTNIVDRPVRASDKVRFSEGYRRFKDNNENQATGTPLAEWPIVSRSMAEELKYLGFLTVEQVAEANDGAISRHMGLVDLKAKAKAYLELAKGNTAPIEAMQKALTEAQQLAKEQAELIQNLKTRMDGMEKTALSKVTTK